MILVAVVVMWLGVVAIAVAIDAGTAYLAENSVKAHDMKLVVKTEEGYKKVKQGVRAYRNLKKIQTGLEKVSQREENVVRPRGAHRRLQAS